MKKIISISLSVFLVIGAVVLITGGTQANAGPINNLYAGNWVTYAKGEANDDDYVDVSYQVGKMTVGLDGVIVVTVWNVVDLAKTDWTSSEVTEYDTSLTFTNSTVSADNSYVAYSLDYTEPTGVAVSISGRCYGMLKSSVGYTEMRCINIQALKGGPFDLDQKNVTRAVIKRESQMRP